ncbi:MAG: peptidoglycan editing factor PgeF [Chloroflexi bacterium]|nr:peptidoglycan editing factor PgeF [Chloroflexota bacterium]
MYNWQVIRFDDSGLISLRPREQFGKGQFLWAAFGRQGGVSEGPFSSLNVGYHLGDDGNHVTDNRVLIARSLSLPPDSLVAAQQVHGSTVAVVDESDRGRGAASWEGALAQTDAMVTAARQTFLMLVVADCAVLTFFDPVVPAIGIAHCGWRGMIAGLGQKTVETMHATFGSRPEDLKLIISPSIGPCCYEVGEAVLSPLRAAYSDWRSLIRESGNRIRLDLWQMARRQALDSGLQSANIFAAEICTACHTDLFYSHRAEGSNTGRFAVLAGIL